jgi:hypothetical protein
LALSLASCTFGWSNGLMPSTHPATAVANCAMKNRRPRSVRDCSRTVSTGCPASISARQAAAWDSSGLSAVDDVDEHAVAAVGAGTRERLARHRQDARALLAGRFGHQLLGPEPERRQGRIGDERELVAAAERELSEHEAEPQARAGFRALGFLAVLHRHLRAVEHRVEVDAEQRGGHEAEVRQGAVAAADLGVVAERAPEVVFLGDVEQAGARIGDGDPVSPVALARVEVLEQRQGLDRPAGLGREDEERPSRIDGALHGGDLQRLGGVEHVQVDAAGTSPNDLAEDLGSERGPAHAQQDRVREALVLDSGSVGLELSGFRRERSRWSAIPAVLSSCVPSVAHIARRGARIAPHHVGFLARRIPPADRLLESGKDGPRRWPGGR